MLKKIFLVVVLFLFMFIPISVNAASVRSAVITGPDEKALGENLSVSFVISFSDVEKNNVNSLGIVSTVFELIFDESVLSISGITSPNFVSDIYRENGKYFVQSEILDSISSTKVCMDGVLFCSDYLVTIDFFIKNTEKTSTAIQIGEIAAGLFPMILPGKEYLESDMVIITGKSDKVKTVKIHKTTDTIPQEPASIVSDTKPVTPEKKFVPKETPITTTAKSNNKYLSSIEIENYTLDFRKEQTSYELLVDNNVNQLTLKVGLEDTKATYQIIGADDLAKSNRQVTIVVTAENGEKNTYTINVRTNNDDTILNGNKKQEVQKKKFKLEKKYIYIAGGVMAFFIMMMIIIKIRDHKIEKSLDQF